MRVGKERDGGERWRSMLYGWLTEYEVRGIEREGEGAYLSNEILCFNGRTLRTFDSHSVAPLTSTSWWVSGRESE